MNLRRSRAATERCLEEFITMGYKTHEGYIKEPLCLIAHSGIWNLMEGKNGGQTLTRRVQWVMALYAGLNLTL